MKQRILALLLTLSLLLSCLPLPGLAQETASEAENAPLLTEATEETAAPQESTAPPEETTEPSLPPEEEVLEFGDAETLLAASASGKCGVNLSWSYDGAKTLTITGSGAMVDYDWNNNKNAPWYSYKHNITTLRLPSGLTTIGDDAFNNLYYLTDVTIPESVTHLGDGSFSNCDTLTEITIPGGVSWLGDYSFLNCYNLSKVIFEGSPPSYIGSNAFYEVTATVVYSADNPNWNSGLHQNYGGKLTWSPSRSSIASGECGSNLTWTLEDGVLTISGTGSMTHYSSTSSAPWYSYRSTITSVAIGSEVTSIGDYAFFECSALTNVSLPSSITGIGIRAFAGCTALEQISLPDSVTYIGGYAFYGCTALTGISLPANLRSVSTYAFFNCSRLSSLILPQGSSEICEYAFGNCTSLTAVTLPENLQFLRSNAFQGCTGLRSIEIPTGVGSLGSYAFDQCTSLEKVTLHDGLKYIGGYAFQGCTALTEIPLPNTLLTISQGAFMGCTGLTGISIPASVTTLELYPFQNCTGLTRVTFEQTDPSGSSISMGTDAFQGCTALTDVTLPAAIGYDINCFNDCSSLTSIIIPASAKAVGGFQNCTALRNVILQEGLTTIYDNAFAGCTSLTSIVIPASVTTLGGCLFTDALDVITFQGDAPTFNSATFRDNARSSASIYPVTATAYYPKDNATWTEEVRQDYCGAITWVPYGEEGLQQCGDSLYWELNDGELTVFGSGEMWPYGSESPAPWAAYADSIYYATVNGATSISSYAFYNCKNLKSITLPDTLATVGVRAFAGCTSLKTLMLPAAMETIEYRAFENCASLTALALWTGPITVRADAFTGVNAMVFYPSTKEWDLQKTGYGGTLVWKAAIDRGSYGVDGGMWAMEADYGLNLCGLKTIYQDTTAPWASYFSHIREIVLDRTVETIGADSFRSHTALTTLTFLGNAPAISETGLSGLDVKAYYPMYDLSWNKGTRLPYGGTITWATDYRFQFGIDNFSFYNREISFGKSGETPFFYKPEDMLNFYFSKNVEPVAFLVTTDTLDSFLTKGWTGSCYGMSLVAGLMKIGALNPYEYGGTSTYAISPVTPDTDTAIESLINVYQFAQWQHILSAKAGLQTATMGNGDFARTLADIWEKALQVGTDGKEQLPFILYLEGTKTSDGEDGNHQRLHAVLCYGAETGSYVFDGKTYHQRLTIYEPGQPQEEYIYVSDDFAFFTHTTFVNAYHTIGLYFGDLLWQNVDWSVKANQQIQFNTYLRGHAQIVSSTGSYLILENGSVVDYKLLDPNDFSWTYLAEDLTGSTGSGAPQCAISFDNPNASYTFTTESGSVDATISFNGIAMGFEGTAASVTFHPDGTVTAEAPSGPVTVTLASNDGSFDFLTLEGTPTGNSLRVTMTEHSLAFQGQLQGGTITASSMEGESDTLILPETEDELEILYTEGSLRGVCAKHTPDAQDPDVCAICGTSLNESLVRFVQASVSLSGDIGLNYYVALSQDIAADPGAYLQFSFDGQTQKIPLSQAVKDDSGAYRFSCKLSARNMADTVTAQVYTASGAVGVSKAYSVREYCTAVIKAYSGNASYAKLVNLLNAMLNYGAQSQRNLNHNVSDLANSLLSAENQALPAITAADAAPYAGKITGTEDGIKIYSASLLLKTTTTIRVYLQLTGSKTIDQYTITADGQTVTPVHYSGKFYYVDLVGIRARDLDTVYTFQVGGTSLGYSGLGYVSSTLSQANVTEDAVNMARALWGYAMAANGYFGN